MRSFERSCGNWLAAVASANGRRQGMGTGVPGLAGDSLQTGHLCHVTRFESSMLNDLYQWKGSRSCIALSCMQTKHVEKHTARHQSAASMR